MSNLSDFLGGSSKKWVAGNYDEGKVVWSPSDFQDYRRKSTGASATDPASDLTGWHPTGDRAIKSIQRGTTTMSGTFSTTVTISSVVTGKTELRMLGYETNQIDNQYSPRIVLTNSTTITLNRSQSGGTTTVSWELTERH